MVCFIRVLRRVERFDRLEVKFSFIMLLFPTIFTFVLFVFVVFVFCCVGCFVLFVL